MTRHLPFLLAIAILSAFALTPAAAQTAPCQAPAGRLRTLASRHPEIADLIGCPSSDETAITLSVQRFEHGWVLGERVPQSDSQVLTEVLFEDDQHYVRYDSPSPELANHDRARLGEPIGRAQVAPARGQFFEHGRMVWDPRTGSAFALVIRGVADQPDAERVWWLFTDQVTSSATRTPSSPPRTPSAVSRTPTRIPPTPTPTTPLAANAVVASAPGTLSGRVVWCTNGLPTAAPDVQVTVTGTLLSAITDSVAASP